MRTLPERKKQEVAGGFAVYLGEADIDNRFTRWRMRDIFDDGLTHGLFLLLDAFDLFYLFPKCFHHAPPPHQITNAH